MTQRSNTGMKYLGVLFVAILFALSVACSIGILVVIPLVLSAIHGDLYFPTTRFELIGLACFVLGTSVVISVLMWLEGKHQGRW